MACEQETDNAYRGCGEEMSNRGLKVIISRTLGKQNGRRMLLDHFSYPAEVSRIGLTEFQVLSKRPHVKEFNIDTRLSLWFARAA